MKHECKKVKTHKLHRIKTRFNKLGWYNLEPKIYRPIYVVYKPIGTVSKKVLDLGLHVRAKPALCSYGITRVAEIFTRVHEKQRPGVIARKYVRKNVGNVLIIHQLAPPLSLLVPPTACWRRLSTVARSLPKPSFWYIPRIKANLPSATQSFAQCGQRNAYFPVHYCWCVHCTISRDSKRYSLLVVVTIMQTLCVCVSKSEP